MWLTLVPVLLALGSHSNAQSWSITAHAPVVGTATATAVWQAGFPTTVTNSATLPVGPVPLGTFLTCSASQPGGSGSVNMSWIPSVVGSSAPLAFTASLSSASSGNYSMGSFGSATGNARIELALHAPQPVGGLLRVRALGSDYGAFSFSRIDLDVNADGTIEVSAQTATPSTTFDLPLQVSATGAVIRLSYNSSTQAGGASSSSATARTIEALFFPGEPIIAPFATFIGASTMSVDHGSPGTVTLSIAGPGLTPVLMVFGGTPISVSLWPYLTVLVSPDVLIATPSGSLTVPLPPLPPGALYAQGLVVDSAGTLRGTNSVRFLWL